MKSYYLLPIIAVLAISALLFFKSSKPSEEVKSPKEELKYGVTISPATQDLGEVIYGDVASTKFTLANSSGKPLKITRVSTSCGCTKASTEKENLGVSEQTSVNVTFDPAVHKDDTDIGDITRSIYIDTDNSEFPRLEVTITARVVKK